MHFVSVADIFILNFFDEIGFEEHPSLNPTGLIYVSNCFDDVL